MTLYRLCVLLLLAATGVACRSEVGDEPTPTKYVWPDAFAFLVETVSETRTDSVVVGRNEEKKIVLFAARDEQYLVWHDGVVKESLVPGRPPAVEAYVVEDTLHYYASLDGRGEVTHSAPGCDPGVPTCRDALPSALPLEPRRFIAHLPAWAGGAAAPPGMRATGLRGTGFRGRAYLAGSIGEPLLSAPPQ